MINRVDLLNIYFLVSIKLENCLKYWYTNDIPM